MIASRERLGNISLNFYVVKTDFSTISCVITLLVNDMLHIIAKISCGWSIPKLAILWVKVTELRKQHLQNSLGVHFLGWKTHSRFGCYIVSQIESKKKNLSFFVRDCKFYCSRFFCKTDQSYGSSLQNPNLIPIKYVQVQFYKILGTDSGGSTFFKARKTLFQTYLEEVQHLGQDHSLWSEDIQPTGFVNLSKFLNPQVAQFCLLLHRDKNTRSYLIGLL